MPNVPIVLDIPENIQSGILSGIYKRNSSVVRNQSGVIVKHLNETQLAKETKSSILSDSFKQNKKTIILGITTIVAAGGLYLKYNNNKKNRKMDAQKCVTDFKKSFCLYLNAASNGTLDTDTIDNLINSLKEINKINNTNEDIILDFTSKEFEELTNRIIDYTKQLADYKKYKLKNIEISNNNIINLSKYLEVQKELLKSIS